MIPINKQTPQERFKAIIKDSLHLVMKKHGFHKQGIKYLLASDKLTYLMTTYKSRWNTKDKMDFRLEWGVALNEDQKKPEVPFKAEALYGELSDLTNQAKDQWFTLEQNDTDSEATDQQIKERISYGLENEILPFIFSFKSIEDIINTLENTPYKEAQWGTPDPGPQTQRWLAILYYFIGKPEKSLEIIDKLIKENKIQSFREVQEQLRNKILENIKKSNS
jgi:hypothetical protein